MSAHEHGDKRRYNREHNGSDNDAGSIPAREAGDEVLGSRLFLRGVFNEFENLRDRALFEAALRSNMDNAGKIYRSARHSVTDSLVCGQALACQGGGIDRSRAVDYLAVKRNLFAGLDNYSLAELNFLGRHGFLFSVAHDYGIVGTDIHERGYRLAALADRDALEQLADLIEYHDRRGFAVIADAERADSGDGHEEMLIEHLTVGNIAYSVPQDIVAYHKIRRDIQQQFFPALKAEYLVDCPGKTCQHDRYDYSYQCFLLLSRHRGHPSYLRIIVQSGSTFFAVLTTFLSTSSKASSAASRVSFWVKKLTLTLSTPSTLAIAASIFAAQFAQSRSSSLKIFFIVLGPFFNKMFETFGYNRSDMVVRKKIIDCFALTAVGDKICVLEYLELVRYRRLRHAEQFRNSANAHLRLKERKQNLDAGRVAEEPEQIGQVAKQLVCRQLVPHHIEHLLVVVFHVFVLRSFAR